MALKTTSYTRPRKSYQKIKPCVEPPYLIEAQIQSYKKFLQAKIKSEDRKDDYGIQAVFKSVFPVHDAPVFRAPAALRSSYREYRDYRPVVDKRHCIAR